MSLIKRPEWPLANTWLSDFFDNRFSDSDLLRNQSLPAVNVKETENTFEIEVAAPGLSKKDFKVTADHGVLTISSEKEEQKERKDEAYTRMEFSFSSFTRSFALPNNVNAEEIKAKYEEGVLKLSVAKKNITPAKPTKTIEVR